MSYVLNSKQQLLRRIPSDSTARYWVLVLLGFWSERLDRLDPLVPDRIEWIGSRVFTSTWIGTDRKLFQFDPLNAM
jgi:hypothetical protein